MVTITPLPLSFVFFLIPTCMRALSCLPLCDLLSFVFFLIPTCMHALSCLPLCDLLDYSPPSSSVRGIFPGKITDIGYRLLLQEIFPTQGWNLCLHIGRQMLCLGSPSYSKLYYTYFCSRSLGWCLEHINSWISTC